MIYNIGNFFSKLILKNIYLFIALGIIRWLQYHIPSFDLYGTYFEIYLLPISLAYTSANMIEKDKGGTIAIITSSFFIFLNPNPSINQGIIIGVTIGFLIKYLNTFIKKYIFGGLQMFSINFIYPLIALILGKLYFEVFQYTVLYFNFISNFLIHILNNIYGLIILTPILEIGKIFFFNNLINHGILSILGFNQLAENGKSILFLLETNPGPGLGVLLALLFTRQKAKDRVNLVSNIFVEVIGGIHEIYFPYILKNLKLLWAVCIAGLVGNITFYSFNAGLISIASPGSILNLFLLSEKKDTLSIFLGFSLSTITSFLIAYFLTRKAKIIELKSEKPPIYTNIDIDLDKVKNIIFLCDAGMGSSAIGANMLRSILEKTKYNYINIFNTFIGDKIENVDFIVTHKELKNTVEKEYPNKKIIFLEDFLDKDFYVNTFLKDKCIELHTCLSLKSTSKLEALKKLGDELENLGFVDIGYRDSLIEREITCSTYLGNGIAIPHGAHSSMKSIKKNGVLIHHYPYGIDFENGEKVYILIGMAIKDHNLRLDYISNIVKNIENEELIENLILSDEEEDFVKAFNGGTYVK